MPKSAESIEKTKQSIIRAAYTLFSTQGYSATSIRQVAKEASIAQGGLYNHFADKEALFVAVMVQYMPFLRIQSLMESAPDNSKRDFLQYVLRALITEYHVNPGSLKLLLTELIEFEGKHSEELIRPVSDMFQHMIQHLASLDGEMRVMSPAVLFRGVMGVAVSQYIGDALTGGLIGSVDPEEAITAFLDGILVS